MDLPAEPASPTVARLRAQGISERLARGWIAEHGEAEVERRMDEVAKRPGVRSAAAYISTVMAQEGRAEPEAPPDPEAPAEEPAPEPEAEAPTRPAQNTANTSTASPASENACAGVRIATGWFWNIRPAAKSTGCLATLIRSPMTRSVWFPVPN